MDISAKVTTREARSSDYQAVLEIIDDLWGGADYMFRVYPDYLKDQRAASRVAVLDGKMVAFTHAAAVDETTMVTSGGRVKAELAGQRVMARLIGEATGDILRRFPSITTWLFSAIDSKFYNRMRKGEVEGTLVYDRHFLHYQTDTPAVRSLMNDLSERGGSSGTRLLSPGQVHATLRGTDLSCLFPEPYFLYAITWTPAAVTVENIVAATTYDTKHALTVDSTGRCSALSFGSCIETPTGSYLSLFYHGEDQDNLLHHLYCHLQANSHIYNTNTRTVIEIFFPKILNKFSVKRDLFPALGDNVITEVIPRENAIIVKLLVQNKTQTGAKL